MNAIQQAKLNEMDQATKVAAKELKKDWTAEKLARWLEKWYPVAGYKRLAKTIISFYVK